MKLAGPLGRLTDRQKEILRLVAHGYTSKQIAKQLLVSPSTVDNHLRAAIALLGADSRSQAARWLVRAEHDQTLPSQPEPLPSAAPSSQSGGQEARSVSEPAGLPPIGGGPNDLDWTTRTALILRIAVVALVSVTAMTLLIAGVLKLIS